MNYKLAAGILPYCPTTKRFLISQRGPDITEPNKWVCFGGKADDGETEQYTAIREFREESGYKGKVKLINKPFYNYNKLDGFKFATFIGLVPNEFIPTTINKETVDGDIEIQDAKWIDKQQLFKLIDSDIIHRGFNTFLLKLFKIKENMKLTENQSDNKYAVAYMINKSDGKKNQRRG
jgi:8-oxo-dGTP pyrophosphatase MutT (NUDIX family)